MDYTRRIFISGGGGFIAPHLLSRIPSDWHVTLHIRNATSPAAVFRQPHIDIITGPMGDRELLAQLPEGIDVVIHLAGAVQSVDTAAMLDSNLVTTHDVLSVMEKRRIPKIVFMSTASVWSDALGTVLTEQLSPNPSTAYGYAKLAAERLINGAIEQSHIETGVVLRCNNTYGPGCVQGVVAAFKGRLEKGLPIQIYGDGEQLREPLYVADLVDVILRSVGAEPGMHVYGISGPRAMTILEMGKVLAATLSVDMQIEWKPDDPERVRHIVMDTSKVRRELNWTPAVQYAEGVLALCRSKGWPEK